MQILVLGLLLLLALAGVLLGWRLSDRVFAPLRPSPTPPVPARPAPPPATLLPPTPVVPVDLEAALEEAREQLVIREEAVALLQQQVLSLQEAVRRAEEERDEVRWGLDRRQAMGERRNEQLQTGLEALRAERGRLVAEVAELRLELMELRAALADEAPSLTSARQLEADVVDHRPERDHWTDLDRVHAESHWDEITGG